MKILILESIIFESLKDLKISYNEQGISDAAIAHYIERFKEIRDRRDFERLAKKYFPHINNVKDLNQYKNFEELEKIVDAFPKPLEKNDATLDGGDAIYNNNGLEIYKGTDKKACIKYGSGYSWCISTKSGGNLFNKYRHQDEERMFYFVFDRKLPTSNHNHAIVIHVYKNGKYGFSNAENKGDIDNITWNKITSIKPNLARLKNYFKYIPLTDEERTIHKKITPKVKRDVKDLMVYFGDYKTVEQYIEYGHQITGEQFFNLSDELQEAYFSRHNLIWQMYKQMTLKNKIKYLKLKDGINTDIIKNIDSKKEKDILMKKMLSFIDESSVIKMKYAVPLLLSYGNNKQLEYYFEEFFKKIHVDSVNYTEDRINDLAFYNNLEPFLLKKDKNYGDLIMDKLIEYNKNSEKKFLFKEDDLEYFNGMNILKYSKMLEDLKKIPNVDELRLIFKENSNYAIELILSVKDKILSKHKDIKDRIIKNYKSVIGEDLIKKLFNI
ncbi:MAG: hypothetical protein KDC90_03175 [Ignavibacteriae bacterium]|nr:hypothetical protein [Ignavibacteriota bacterium]